ncbi:MAG: Bro-N domain-containing protein [Candidatus Gottesmanbacteria bacterium]|nr:Bro-N domain-containing protein [Candidatus Gottesmanbacteria bacterium]
MTTRDIETTKIALFKGRKIRKTIFHAEWWFSVVDIIAVLTDSKDPRDYWFKMKIRVKTDDSFEPSTICRQLKLAAADGKMRETDCANTEGIFRIIQSVPSPKAEPLKRWLARVGYERIAEIEDPELSMKRMKAIYKQKGYSKEWVEKRVRGISVRNELTDEWMERGADESIDYAILTNDIMKGAFNLTVEDYKKLKGLQRQNLRDHMTDIELILTMLGEATTTKFHRDRNSRGFPNLDRDAKDGGSVAGRTRRDIEQQSKKRVVSSENYMPVKKTKIIKSL